jgi:hypothetical protein
MTDRLAAARAKLIDYVVLDDGPGLKSAKTRKKDKINSQCKQSRKHLTVTLNDLFK